MSEDYFILKDFFGTIEQVENILPGLIGRQFKDINKDGRIGYSIVTTVYDEKEAYYNNWVITNARFFGDAHRRSGRSVVCITVRKTTRGEFT